MGIYSDYCKADYHGHKIEVKGETTCYFPVTMNKYTLYIDGRRQDSTTVSGFEGAKLDGEVDGKRIAIIIKLGFFNNKFFLEVDGWMQQMEKVY